MVLDLPPPTLYAYFKFHSCHLSQAVFTESSLHIYLFCFKKIITIFLALIFQKHYFDRK